MNKRFCLCLVVIALLGSPMAIAHQKKKLMKPPMDLVLYVLRESGYQVRGGEVYFDRNTHLGLSDIVAEWWADPIDLNGDGIVEYILYPQSHPFSGNAVGAIMIYRKTTKGYQSLWDGEERDGWSLLARIVQLTTSTNGYSDLRIVDSRNRLLATLRFGGRLYKAVTASSTKPSPAPSAQPKSGDNFEDFYAKFRTVVNNRDRAALKDLMSLRFEWAADGNISRDEAFKNIGEIIGWQKFWQSAQKAVARKAEPCRKDYAWPCSYHVWTKSPFPIELAFGLANDGRWKWVALPGD